MADNKYREVEQTYKGYTIWGDSYHWIIEPPNYDDSPTWWALRESIPYAKTLREAYKIIDNLTKQLQ